MKRLISIALVVVVMLLSMIPSTIFAKSYEADIAATTAANVIDGIVSDGEYAWASGEYARGEDVENEFDAGVGCDAPYGKTLKSQWWLDYDQEFIYIAYKEDRHNASSQTIGIIDLNPGAKEQGQVSLAFTITGANASFEYNGYNFEVSTYDGEGKHVVNETDIVKEKATKQVEPYHNVLEFKIDRAALAAYAGESFNELGIRAQINSYAEYIEATDTQVYQNAVFGDPDSDAKAYDRHLDKGYHIVDVTPCVHDFGDGWYEVTPATCVDGEDNRVCSICEGIEVRIVPASGDHEFGDWAETTPPTCADPGEKTRECINCDEEETAPVDPTGEHDYQTIGISLEQHADVCTVCGDTINAEAHVDPTETSEGHTYWSPAYVAVDCSVCAGYKVVQAPINGRLLNTNGQRHIFCSATKAAPTVDGAVLAGEYTWSLKGVNANNLPVGTCASNVREALENVNFYVSYDDSKVYVAIEVTDRSTYVAWGTSAYVSVGGGDMLDGYQCYLAIANGATVIEAIQRTNNVGSNVDPSGKAASYSTKSGSNYVYEIAFDREACGLTGDSMYLAMAVATSAGNIMFATKDVAVEGYDKLNFDAGAMYPNVLFFGTMEEKADYIATFGVDAPVCTHESAEYAYLNATKHQLVCFCGKVDTVEHSFVYFQNDEKSHTSICVDCGAQVNEAHKTGTATSANELIHNITCVCGEAFSSEHIYGMINVLESATHTKAGKGEKACLVCDYVVAVDIPATTAHNFAAWTNDGDTHTSVCACGETVTEAHNYVDGVCSVCRAIKAAAPTEDAPNADGADDTTTDSGCKASVAAFAVALVAMLGTCTVFVAKKKD